MEIRQLTHFGVVAEELNFSRAAKKLHLSQPPLTLSIQKLERELGVQLFYRGNRGVTLTEAGKIFHEETRRILSDLERAKEKLVRHQEGFFGSLRVGFMVPFCFSFIPYAVQGFRARYPFLHVDLTTSFPGQEMERLRQNQIDVNLGSYCEPDSQLNSLKLMQTPLTICVSDLHPLAKQKTISIRQLRGEPLLVSSASSFPNLQQAMFLFCQKVGGFEPKINRIIDDVPALITLVGAGEGVAILLGCLSQLNFPGVKVIPFQEVAPTVNLGAVWRREKENGVLSAFVKIAKTAATKYLKS